MIDYIDLSAKTKVFRGFHFALNVSSQLNLCKIPSQILVSSMATMTKIIANIFLFSILHDYAFKKCQKELIMPRNSYIELVLRI